MPEVISRKAAKAAGLVKYFTGKPCLKGHISERWVANYACETCLASYPYVTSAKRYEAAKVWATRNPDKRKAYVRSWAKKNAAHRQDYAHSWHLVNKQKVAEKDAKRYALNRTKLVQQSAEWRRLNPDKASQAVRDYRERNADKVRVRGQLWRRNNKHKIRLYGHKYRSSKLGTLSEDIVQKLWSMQSGRCACPCNASLIRGYHIDHVIPISKGGPNTDSNVQLLTPKCNRKKHNKDNAVFMTQQKAKYSENT